VQTLWVGGTGGMEEALVKREGIPYTAIPAAGVHGVDLRVLPGNLGRLTRGFFAAQRILREFRPHVLMFTGGYVAFPMALAARNLPSLLYVPDIEPGMALKAIARFAHTITVTAEDSRPFFNKKSHLVVSGYPTRPELARWERSKARAALSLSEDAPVLLVFGGSKGARSLNRAVLARLTDFLSLAQVVHISGELDWEEVQAAREQLSDEQKARYHAHPYLHAEMGAALASADLAVSRAGASVLGEYPLVGLPSVLVPYPHVWRYQMVNAQYLAQRGAAQVLEDARLPAELFETVRGLFADPAQLAEMRANLHALARPQAAQSIAAELVALAGGHA
jgi:UDP-N-acetylglucosamine--N-acetylmuramyl-(pentapeptide) pyrophosphoryl-undecaprenol N-acetylglucosamine transferase